MTPEMEKLVDQIIGFDWKDDETYVAAYSRNIGPIDQYGKMTQEELRDRWNWARREFGSVLLMLHGEPGCLTGKELLAVIEPHHEAIVKEIQGRLGLDRAKLEKCREPLREMDCILAGKTESTA